MIAEAILKAFKKRLEKRSHDAEQPTFKHHKRLHFG